MSRPLAILAIVSIDGKFSILSIVPTVNKLISDFAASFSCDKCRLALSILNFDAKFSRKFNKLSILLLYSLDKKFTIFYHIYYI